jgi:hypothetical protein
VFDKGEMNIFAETATLTEVVCGQLKNLLCREDITHLFETCLPEKVKNWLLCMCWPHLPTVSDDEKPYTLAEFIKETERMAAFSTDNSHFLFVNAKTEFLPLYKTKKLTEAVCGALKTT